MPIKLPPTHRGRSAYVAYCDECGVEFIHTRVDMHSLINTLINNGWAVRWPGLGKPHFTHYHLSCRQCYATQRKEAA